MKKKMTPQKRKIYEEFAARLALMKHEAFRLGLIRTSHAFDRPTEYNRGDGGIMGPLAVIGWEIIDIIDGKQATP